MRKTIPTSLLITLGFFLAPAAYANLLSEDKKAICIQYSKDIAAHQNMYGDVLKKQTKFFYNFTSRWSQVTEEDWFWDLDDEQISQLEKQIEAELGYPNGSPETVYLRKGVEIQQQYKKLLSPSGLNTCIKFLLDEFKAHFQKN